MVKLAYTIDSKSIALRHVGSIPTFGIMNKKPTKQELIDHVESLVAKCAELTRERDEARREAMLLLSDRASTKEMNAEYKKRGWEYLKNNP